MTIAIEGLSKRFGAVVAIDEVSFTAPDGQVTGFLGANGAGESTTLRCLLGLVRADAGTARFGGDTVRDLDDPAGMVGAALDPLAHHPDRTGRDHLRVLARASSRSDGRVEEVLDLVELTDAAGRRAGDYSTGMRQRLHLAAALLGDPRTLVLDEPTNGLDPPGIAWLRGLLRDLAAEGRCVLLSSHVLGEVARTVDEVVVLTGGRVVAAGTLDAVFGAERKIVIASPDLARLRELLTARGLTHEARDETLIVTGSDARRIAELALDARLLLTELTSQPVDLEERFLALTAANVRPEA